MSAEAYGTDKLLLTLDVPHVDGVRMLYRIVVSADGPHLSAHEESTSRCLPEFCPERHIVDDGFFCMYWSGELTFTVTDSDSAARWLNLLLNFLRLQRRAAKRRRWPNQETWAHGRAAVHQQRAELTADKLGPELRIAVDARELSTSSEAGGALRVLQGNQPLFSVWRSPNRRDRCGHRLACAAEFGAHKRKITHGARAELLEELALALLQWEADENKFWLHHQGRVCCGTIDNCPLRANIGADDGKAI
jgi:hypothetical protein